MAPLRDLADTQSKRRALDLGAQTAHLRRAWNEGAIALPRLPPGVASPATFV